MLQKIVGITVVLVNKPNRAWDVEFCGDAAVVLDTAFHPERASTFEAPAQPFQENRFARARWTQQQCEAALHKFCVRV